MRRVIMGMIVAVFVFSVTVKAQGNRGEVMTGIERALTQPHQDGQCLARYTPQGDPGPQSPRGTKYQFKCQQGDLAVEVFIFYGETTADAEKILADSQRFLQINISREVEGIGDEGYELVQDRYAWIMFHKGNVYCQVNVGIRDSSKEGGPFADKSVSRQAMRESAKRFAQLVVNQVPAR